MGGEFAGLPGRRIHHGGTESTEERGGTLEAPDARVPVGACGSACPAHVRDDPLREHGQANSRKLSRPYEALSGCRAVENAATTARGLPSQTCAAVGGRDREGTSLKRDMYWLMVHIVQRVGEFLRKY